MARFLWTDPPRPGRARPAALERPGGKPRVRPLFPLLDLPQLLGAVRLDGDCRRPPAGAAVLAVRAVHPALSGGTVALPTGRVADLAADGRAGAALPVG